MTKRWLNDRQPDENGDYILVIENANGSRVSTFKGKSIEEVAEALADSQVHANREISRLRKPDAGRPQFKVEPKEITPADRLRLSGAMTDPDTVVEAVEEIITKRSGIAPDKMGVEFGRMSAEERDRYWGQEAQAFREANPDYYNTDENRDALFDELRANGWDFTRNNLAICFQTLKDRDALIPWPDDSEAQIPQEPIPANALPQPAYTGGNGYANGQTTAQPAPSPRPRSVSTGLRHTDASASAPPPPQKKKYTRADVERMSRAEYNDKLRSDPDFRRQVDAMGV